MTRHRNKRYCPDCLNDRKSKVEGKRKQNDRKSKLTMVATDEESNADSRADTEKTIDEE